MQTSDKNINLRPIIQKIVTFFDVILAIVEILYIVPVVWSSFHAFMWHVFATFNYDYEHDSLFFTLITSLLWLAVLLLYMKYRYGAYSVYSWFSTKHADAADRGLIKASTCDNTVTHASSPSPSLDPFLSLAAVSIVSFVLMCLFMPSPSPSAKNIFQGYVNGMSASSLLNVMIFGPIIEELYFRGAIIIALLRHGAFSFRTQTGSGSIKYRHETEPMAANTNIDGKSKSKSNYKENENEMLLIFATSGLIFGFAHVTNLNLFSSGSTAQFQGKYIYIVLQICFACVLGVAYTVLSLRLSWRFENGDDNGEFHVSSYLLPSIGLHILNNTLSALHSINDVEAALKDGIWGLHATLILELVTVLLVTAKEIKKIKETMAFHLNANAVVMTSNGVKMETIGKKGD